MSKVYKLIKKQGGSIYVWSFVELTENMMDMKFSCDGESSQADEYHLDIEMARDHYITLLGVGYEESA